MPGGAPQGNQNGAKGKIVSDAIRKALAAEDWRRLREASERISEAFAKGEPWAVQFVTDRMEGKAPLAVTVAGDGNGDPIRTISEIVIRAVDPQQ